MSHPKKNTVDPERDLSNYLDQRYYYLYQNATDGLFTLDHEGYLRDANKMSERITGYSKEELEKIHFSNLLAQKENAIYNKEDLTLKISSQSDPSWIEQVLMKELGVVPENQIKVHFKN